MIEIGSTLINIISIGSDTPVKIDWGSDQVWPTAVTPTITISPTGATISSAGTDAYIYVTASTNSWTVEKYENEGSNWITVVKDDNYKARYWINSNTSTQRTGEIRFKIDGTVYATCYITQSAAAAEKSISVYPHTIGFLYPASSSTVYVTTSNISSWNAYKEPSDASWLSINKGTDRITFTVTENTGNTARTAYIIASGEGKYDMCEISQNSGYIFYFSPGEESAKTEYVSSAANTYSLTVYSVYAGYPTGVTSSITQNQIGLTLISSTVNSGYYNYVFRYDSASTTSVHTAAVIFTQAGSNKALSFVIVQSGQAVSDYINISPTGYTNVTSAGTALTFNVTASTPSTWSASTSSSWLHLTRATNSRLTVTVDSTTSTSIRTGSISFKIGNVTYTSATITQEAMEAQYFNLTPTAITADSGGGVYSVRVYTNMGTWSASTSLGNWYTMEKSGDFLMLDVAANTVAQQRLSTINFTVNGNTVSSLTLSQQAKYEESEVIVSATSGWWNLGVVKTGAGGPGNLYDVRGLCIVKDTPFAADYTATMTIGYSTGVPPKTSYTLENYEVNIPGGSTFTAMGKTYNGILITGVGVYSPSLDLTIDTVGGFTVN